MLQSEVSRVLGWPTRGYKVGCTSLRAQQLLGTDRPFHAPLFAPRVFDTSAHLPGDVRVVEPEIAFVMRAELAPRAQPYGVDEVFAAVSTVHAAFEVVCPRLQMVSRIRSNG